jgi:hypothetical protein
MFKPRRISLWCPSTNWLSWLCVGSRSQWPRGLMNKMCFPAQTLWSWFRIAFEALISVCVLYCVGIGFETGSSPVQGVLETLYKNHSYRINSEWEEARQPNPWKQKKNSVLVCDSDLSDLLDDFLATISHIEKTRNNFTRAWWPLNSRASASLKFIFKKFFTLNA